MFVTKVGKPHVLASPVYASELAARFLQSPAGLEALQAAQCDTEILPSNPFGFCLKGVCVATELMGTTIKMLHVAPRVNKRDADSKLQAASFELGFRTINKAGHTAVACASRRWAKKHALEEHKLHKKKCDGADNDTDASAGSHRTDVWGDVSADDSGCSSDAAADSGDDGLPPVESGVGTGVAPGGDDKGAHPLGAVGDGSGRGHDASDE